MESEVKCFSVRPSLPQSPSLCCVVLVPASVSVFRWLGDAAPLPAALLTGECTSLILIFTLPPPSLPHLLPPLLAIHPSIPSPRSLRPLVRLPLLPSLLPVHSFIPHHPSLLPVLFVYFHPSFSLVLICPGTSLSLSLPPSLSLLLFFLHPSENLHSD